MKIAREVLRNGIGRIKAIFNPRGNAVRYQYDVRGDLVAVTDRENHTTTYRYLNPAPGAVGAHYLEAITDPLGRTAVTAAYNAEGRLSQLTDATGKNVTIAYDLANLQQTVYDQLEGPEQGTSVIGFDALGNVVRTQEGAFPKCGDPWRHVRRGCQRGYVCIDRS